MATPSDPLFSLQWHFELIGDIETIWNDYDGSGVHVAVYDSALEYDHPDLLTNYDASLHFVDSSGTVYDPYPVGIPSDPWFNPYPESHGTSVAGLIGAVQNNGEGGTGVAPGVTLTGVNLIDDIQHLGENLMLEAIRYAENFDIMSNSWGQYPQYAAQQSLADPTSEIYRWNEAYAYVAANGRNGLGTIIVQAAGNGDPFFGFGVNANGDGINGSRYSATIAATDQFGVAQLYSNWGAGILVAAPAGSVTTDRTGSAGYNGLTDPDYTNNFGGTSAATPIVSGVVALMLEANPTLGWRDVHNILALSASQTGSDYGAASGTFPEASNWGSNDADNWNGGGVSISLAYGYGMVDAYQAVRMAEAWHLFYPDPRTSANEVLVSATYIGTPTPIPDFTTIPGVLDLGILVTQNIEIETIMVTVDITHQRSSDLILSLVTPGGEILPFMAAEGGDTLMDSGFVWTFEVTLMRSSESMGTWILRAEDRDGIYSTGTATGQVNSFTLDFYGAPVTNDDVIHYTNDFLELALVEASRSLIVDADGGTDWVSLVAVQGDVVLDLRAGGTLAVSGTTWATVQTGTVLENIASGDGNDTLTGTDQSNEIHGGRGDDLILALGGDDFVFGEAGDDTLVDDNGSDTYDGGDGIDELLMFGFFSDYAVFEAGGSVKLSFGSDIDTVLSSVELITFSDATFAFWELLGTAEPPATISGISPDSGIPGDFLTNAQNLSFSGTAAAGSTVQISLDGVVVGETTAGGTGEWTYGHSAPVAEGDHLLEVSASLGSGTPSLASQSFTVDLTGPTLAITLDDTELTIGETTLVHFIFTERVAGFDLADVTSTAGSFSGLSTSDGGTTWSALFTPGTNLDVQDATVGVSGDYLDLAGNAGTAATSGIFTVSTLSALNYEYGSNGNDTIAGTAGQDYISGLPEGGGALGVGTIDVLTGGEEADIFLLGTTSGTFYDDGNGRSDGKADYAQITDFVSGEDKIAVYDGLNYVVTAARISGIDGWAIVIDENGNGTADRKEEVIALVTGSAPTGSDFIASTEGRGGTGDTTAPVVTIYTLSTSDPTPALSGTVDDPDAVVEVTVSGTTYSALNNGDGTWSLPDNQVSALSPGTYDVQVTATDLSGNVGTDNSTNELTILGDTTGPTDGNDVIVGTNGDDRLSGVPEGSTLLGTGSIDTFEGLGGADEFVFGMAGQVYYDDGNARSSGKADYGRVLDFDPSEDSLYLVGAVDDYFFENRKISGVDGIAIIWDAEGNGLDSRDEIIGHLVGLDAALTSLTVVYETVA